VAAFALQLVQSHRAGTDFDTVKSDLDAHAASSDVLIYELYDNLESTVRASLYVSGDLRSGVIYVFIVVLWKRLSVCDNLHFEARNFVDDGHRVSCAVVLVGVGSRSREVEGCWIETLSELLSVK
jgi:hypothetical protein